MSSLAASTPLAVEELSTGALLDALSPHADKALVFSCDGQDVSPAYHVTEVKSGLFEALDCGANPEAWRETFIQLWDISGEPGRVHMSVGKFLAIMGKASQRTRLDLRAKLTFEVSDGKRAMQLFAARSIRVSRDAVRVRLAARPASCKPRDRWLEQDARRTGACCA